MDKFVDNKIMYFYSQNFTFEELKKRIKHLEFKYMYMIMTNRSIAYFYHEPEPIFEWYDTYNEEEIDFKKKQIYRCEITKIDSFNLDTYKTLLERKKIIVKLVFTNTEHLSGYDHYIINEDIYNLKDMRLIEKLWIIKDSDEGYYKLCMQSYDSNELSKVFNDTTAEKYLPIYRWMNAENDIENLLQAVTQNHETLTQNRYLKHNTPVAYYGIERGFRDFLIDQKALQIDCSELRKKIDAFSNPERYNMVPRKEEEKLLNKISKATILRFYENKVDCKIINLQVTYEGFLVKIMKEFTPGRVCVLKLIIGRYTTKAAILRWFYTYDFPQYVISQPIVFQDGVPSHIEILEEVLQFYYQMFNEMGHFISHLPLEVGIEHYCKGNSVKKNLEYMISNNDFSGATLENIRVYLKNLDDKRNERLNQEFHMLEECGFEMNDAIKYRMQTNDEIRYGSNYSYATLLTLMGDDYYNDGNERENEPIQIISIYRSNSELHNWYDRLIKNLSKLTKEKYVVSKGWVETYDSSSFVYTSFILGYTMEEKEVRVRLEATYSEFFPIALLIKWRDTLPESKSEKKIYILDLHHCVGVVYMNEEQMKHIETKLHVKYY